MTAKCFSQRAADIDWYCELRGQGPSVVLIPSGEGDCGSFERVTDILADEFTVLTFDMPGYSRSGTPPEFGAVTAGELAEQVSALVESLHLAPATFYGCSSGGLISLSLVSEHSNFVRNVIVHEVPLSLAPLSKMALDRLLSPDDAVVVEACKDLFRNMFNEDSKAWDDLGAEYHRRLEKNYVTWIRHYVAGGALIREYRSEELRKRPITWTIGGLTPTFMFFDNIRSAQLANTEIELLMCRHFPQASIPDQLAEHIRVNARKHLETPSTGTAKV